MAEIRALIPSDARRLIEPFAGSGAVALNLRFRSVLLGDTNGDLIRLFRIVCRAPDRFIAACAREFTPATNNAAAYAQRRAEFNTTRNAFRKACLFVYLNRHGYNGLCRYNQRGGFNVPFGRHPRSYFPRAELLHFAKTLRRAKFVRADFRAVLAQAGAGDFVYCDPPYAPASGVRSGFTAYSPGGFTEKDQCDLADACRAAAIRGAFVVISNHDSALTRALYHGATDIRSIIVPRTISRRVGRRMPVRELLVTFAPPHATIRG